MKRLLILLASAAATAAMTASTALAAAPPASLALRHTSIGTILVDGRGFTLYAFTRDGRNSDACMHVSGCAGIWPLLLSGGKPHLGRGVKSSLVATIAVGGGRRQVTYAGHPLYTYVADGAPGQTGYVGVSQFGGRWPALNAAGREVS